MALNLSLNSVPWKAQLAAAAVLSVAGLGAFWYFYADAQAKDIKTRRVALVKVQGDVTRGLATAKRLPEFKREVAVKEAQLNELKVQLPEEQDVADLLRRVVAMATESNLKINEFTPAVINRKETHAEWPIGLKVEGTYHDIGSFLERVSKYPRIISVGNLKIGTRDEQTAAATVTAEATATTFVLVPQDPDEVPAKGAKGKAKPKAKAKPKPKAA